jgi:hypothetical protein
MNMETNIHGGICGRDGPRRIQNVEAPISKITLGYDSHISFFFILLIVTKIAKKHVILDK